MRCQALRHRCLIQMGCFVQMELTFMYADKTERTTYFCSRQRVRLCGRQYLLPAGSSGFPKSSYGSLINRSAAMVEEAVEKHRAQSS